MSVAKTELPVSDKNANHDDEPVRRSMLDAIPPTGLVLLAITAIQVGAAIAIHLFPVLGPTGTVAARIILSAVLLLLAARARIYSLLSSFRQHLLLLCAFGACIAAMNLFFYLAIERIPLGAAVAIEFIGPLGLAAITSRRLTHIFWVGLAALGIALLSPLAGVDLDPLGVGYALVAGIGWATFVVLAGRVGRSVSGNDGLVIGMSVAALLMLPLVLPVVDVLATRPLILLAAVGVALLSTTIPFLLEFSALQRLTPRAYGVLVSLEPAVAALVGALLLGERIGVQGIAAVMCVVVAAIGITVYDRKN